MSSLPPPPPPDGGTPVPPVVVTSHIDAAGERATFVQRLVGYLVDTFLYLMFSLIFLVPTSILIVQSVKDCNSSTSGNQVSISCTGNQINGGLMAAGIMLGVIGFLVVAFIYVRALGRTGQTWGRKIIGLKVVDRHTAQPLGFGRALGRTLFAQIISGAFCDLGYLWMLWDKDKQTWHDKVVGSVVLKV